MLASETLQATIEHALASSFGAIFSRAEIRSGENYEGEDAIYVKAFLKPNAPRPRGLFSLGAMVALRSALKAAGENREAYLDLDYPVDTSS